MDVGTLSNVQSGIAAYQTASTAKAKTSAAADATQTTQAAGLNAGEAYSVDIQDAAQKASDGVKGLTAEQVDILKEGIAKSQELMIKTLTAQNVKLQGFLDDNISALNFDGTLITTDRFALPAVATTPEEAEKAVGEGGDWSVDAVATRIFDLASTIAGGDPDKLEKMRAAVEKGFEQAGVEFKDATGAKDMPQITKDTYAELMKRFDNLSSQINGTAAASTAAVEQSKTL